MPKFSHIIVKFFYSNERDAVTLAVVFFLPFLSVINAIHSQKKKGNFNISRALSYTSTTLNSKSRELDEICLRTHAPIRSTFVTLKRLTKQH